MYSARATATAIIETLHYTYSANIHDAYITNVSETIQKPPLVKAETALKNKNKIKYGVKRFSIWRTEFLQPSMLHVALES